MQAEPITRPMISLDVLGKMVRNLSPEQLAKLPVEKLPEHVPEVIYTIGTPEKNAILEELLIKRDTERMSRQVSDLEHYGKEIADALTYAESSALPPTVNEFVREVDAFQSMIQGGVDAANAKQVEAKTAELHELLARIAASSFLKSQRALEELLASGRAGTDQKRVLRARRKLAEKLTPAVDAVSRFHSLRVSVAHAEMSELRKRIKKEASNQGLLQEQIDELRAQLSQQSSLWRRALGKYHSSPEYTQTQEKISQLITKKQLNEVVIDDTQLVKWLDAIVDASLDTNDNKKQGVHASRVLLLSLLEMFCRQQEESAVQIAQNPFSQIDPKQAVKFVLASERFILDYFAKKQEESAALFRTTANSRRNELDNLMKSIVKELKRNMRKLKG